MAFGEVGTALSKIKSPAVNLADTFAFSGTVTGFDKTSLTLLSTFTSDGSDANATFNSSIITSAGSYSCDSFNPMMTSVVPWEQE